MVNGNGWWHLYQVYLVPTLISWKFGVGIVTVTFSIWLILWLRSHFREDAEDADETLEMLTQFRDLHQEGGLSDDEFRLIKSRLATTVQGTRKDATGKTDQASEIAKHDNVATAEVDAKSERMTDEENGLGLQ